MGQSQPEADLTCALEKYSKNIFLITYFLGFKRFPGHAAFKPMDSKLSSWEQKHRLIWQYCRSITASCLHHDYKSCWVLG